MCTSHLKNIFRLILLFILLPFCILKGETVDFRHFSARTVIPDVQGRAILKDSVGFMWFGTTYGVSRYDGTSVIDTRFRTGHSFAWEQVNALCELPEGHLLVGNALGLWILNRYTFTFEHIFQETTPLSVHSMISHPTGYVYIGTSTGLYQYDPSTRELELIFTTVESMSEPHAIVRMEIDNEGTLWFIALDTLINYNPANKSVKTYPIKTGIHLTDLAVGSKQIWLGAEDGNIYRFDRSTFIVSNCACLNDLITCVALYNENYLLASTHSHGLFVLASENGGIAHTFTQHPVTGSSIASDYPARLYTDPEGRIWIGYTTHAGISLLTPENSFFKIYKEEGFSTKGRNINRTLITEKGKLFYGWDGLFFIQDNGKVFSYNRYSTPHPQPHHIRAMIEYEGNFLIGTDRGGIKVLDSRTGHLSDHPYLKELLTRDTHYFYKDKQGSLWIATNRGIYKYEASTHALSTFTTLTTGLPDNFTTYIYEDRQQRVWIVTRRGAALLDPLTEEIVPVEQLDPYLENNGIYTIFDDAGGNLYFSLTNGHKLLRANPTLTHIEYITGTPDGTTFGDIPHYETPWNGITDNEGNLWMLSKVGIMRMDHQTGEWQLFSVWNGLHYPVMVNAAYAHKDTQGHLWLANVNGMIHIDPSQPYEQPTYKLVVTELAVNGIHCLHKFRKQLREGTPLVLKKGEQNLHLRITSLSYVPDPANILYEYKLSGIDSTWQRTTGSRPITYTNLPPGNYRLEYRELMNNHTRESLSFIITAGPPVDKAWFTLGIVTLCIIGFILFRKKNRNPITQPIETASTPEQAERKEIKEEEEKYRHAKIDEQKAREVIETVEHLLRTDKAYLNPDFKIHDLAQLTGYSAPILSQVLNQYLNVRFYEYITSYRIEEFKRYIRETAYTTYTLA
ncbi:MAG: hypothetical protein LUD74_07125, partial [Tannerellaceae bacterium]|nr:hypothetical protein [Tannerellaceae bacterium]